MQNIYLEAKTKFDLQKKLADFLMVKISEVELKNNGTLEVLGQKLKSQWFNKGDSYFFGSPKPTETADNKIIRGPW